MKKIIFISTMLLLACVPLNVSSQNTEVKQDKKIFADLTAGPSFAVGNFAHDDTTIGIESKDGFAKTGFKIGLNFGYMINKNFGITSHWFYGLHKLDVSKFGTIADVSVDHWKYYGVLVGPMAAFSIGDDAMIGLKAMGGISNVNSPAVQVDNAAFLDEKWASAFTLLIGAEMKYSFNDNFYFIAGLDYNYMKPSFNIVVSNGGGFFHSKTQEIGCIIPNAGIGIKF